MISKLISDQKELTDVCAAINECSIVGVDTEFLREKTYYAKLCLVQLAAGGETWCIDVLSLDDLSPLEAIFKNTALLKVFHSSRQDFEVIFQQLGCLPTPVFDTQIAASFCGLDAQAGYATVLKKVFDIELDKSQTRTDWSRRPLSDKQIEYAINDVRHLEALYQHYQQRLQQLGREPWFAEEIAALFQVNDYLMPPEEAHQRLNGSCLTIASQYFLRDLAQWRESLAQSKNIPRTWILKDKDIYALAELMPDSIQALQKSAVGQQAFVKKNAQTLLDMARQHQGQGDSDALWKVYRPFEPEQKTRVKEIMQRIADIAKQEKIAQTVLATRRDVEAFVRNRQHSAISQGWRAEFLLEKISR